MSDDLLICNVLEVRLEIRFQQNVGGIQRQMKRQNKFTQENSD